MTISPVGGLVANYGTTLKTLAYTPNAIGDLVILATSCQGVVAKPGVTAVSGGGVTTWTRLIYANPGSNYNDVELWMGVITSVGGSKTITITASAAVFNVLGVQEFAASYTAKWIQDGSGAASTSTTSSTGSNFPSVTPTGGGELCVGGLFGSGTLGGSSTGSV